MELKIFITDAFTATPFSGNPAAVVLLDKVVPDDVLQKVAAEFNLSETAYVTPSASHSEYRKDDSSNQSQYSKEARFKLRWFTPTNEVPLCGHATLASAHVLFNCEGNTSKCIEFETLSGVLKAQRELASITLDFPCNPPSALTPPQSDALEPLLALFRAKLPVVDARVSTGARKLLVRIDDSCTRRQLESFSQDDRQMLQFHDGSIIKGVILTVKGGSGCADEYNLKNYDFASRYFAIWNGISEDPVTGSAHTVLGPYWAEVLGKTQLKCRQCSSRGGDLDVVVRADHRVNISGQAVTVVKGVITL